MQARSTLRPTGITGRTLRQKVLRRFALIAIIALIAAVTAFAFALDRILSTSAGDLARAETASIAADLRSMSPTEAVRNGASGGHVVQVVRTFGPRAGSIEASSGGTTEHPLAGPAPLTKSTTSQRVFRVGGNLGPYVVATRPAHNGQRSYTVAVAVSMKTSGDVVDRSVIALTLAAAALFAVSLWGISRVISSALAPVERIRAEVDGIRASGSDARVTVPNTDDEISRLAQTMNSMLERLDQAGQSQRAFISDASHELRSPLTTILLLSEGQNDNDPTRATIHREASRLQAIVEDMLLLAKADDGQLPLRHDDVDFDDIVLAETTRLRAVSHCAVSVSITPARLSGDATRLTQVVRNLTDNAARHANSEIRIRLTTENSRALLTVDNDGAPVPKALRDKIFDRFVRLDEARNRDAGGSGLGLAIAKAIVVNHAGHIDTSSTDDGWCRFTVSLPLAP